MPANRKIVWPFSPTLTMFSDPEAPPGVLTVCLRVPDLANLGYPEAGLPDRVGRKTEVIGKFVLKIDSGKLLQRTVALGRR